MKRAVVLLNLNDSERIVALAQRLQSFRFFDNIVVVDNNSCLEQKKLLTALEGLFTVTVLYNEVNSGFSGGNNLGLTWLLDKGIGIVFLMNSDIAVESDLLYACENFLAEHENISIVTAVMHEYDQIKQYYYNFPTVFRIIKDNLGLSTLFHYKPKVLYEMDDFFTVDYSRSSFWAVRYSDFERVGFFDPNTFLYYVETCVGLKMRALKKESAVLKKYSYEHNHIYKKGYKIKGYKDAHKSLLYIFKTYYHIGFLKRLMVRISYRIGLCLRCLTGRN